MKRLFLTTIAIGTSFSITSPTIAACTVPNTITNGQVADASKVMGNFTALASCAQQGNLTGDVTTSGGTVTTLSNSGVTPGSYSSANISVDAKGRVTTASNGSGGSGGSKTEATWTIPTVSAFAWTNQGATATATNTAFGIAIRDDTAASSANFRILDEAAPTTTPWAVYARLSPFLNPTSSSGQAAIIIRNGSSGKFLEIGPWESAPGAFLIQRWDGANAYSSTPVNTTTRQSAPYWIKVSNDGTNISVSLSSDGINWALPVYSEALSSYLVSASRIGFGLQLNNQPTGMTVNSFSTTAPTP